MIDFFIYCIIELGGYVENIIKIIIELEGIIGAILGVVATLIVTDILKRKGKLEIYIVNAEGNFYYNDDGFRTKKREKGQEIDYYRFELEFSVYNKSDIPKVIRDVKVELYVDNKFVLEQNVQDEETRRYGNHYSVADDAKIFNIEPKKADIFKFTFFLNDDIARKLVDKKVTFKLRYYNEKNKRKDFVFYDELVKEPRIKEEEKAND